MKEIKTNHLKYGGLFIMKNSKGEFLVKCINPSNKTVDIPVSPEFASNHKDAVDFCVGFLPDDWMVDHTVLES